jgi:hypothetical protein
MVAEMVPDASLDDIEQLWQEAHTALCGILRAANAWLTAGELATIAPEYNERRVRAIANSAGSRILSFPGSPGYRLASQATVTEINHAIEAIEAQARAMLKRSIELRRAYHSRGIAA